jgi:hypothetical protein
MEALIRDVRAPYLTKLDEKLATTDGLLYRRGTFNGTSDQLILEALLARRMRRSPSPRDSLGHDAAARAGDPDGAPDGPDGRHVSLCDGQ